MDSDQNNDMTIPAPQEPINADAFQPQPGQVIDVPSYPSEPMRSEPVVQPGSTQLFINSLTR